MRMEAGYEDEAGMEAGYEDGGRHGGMLACACRYGGIIEAWRHGSMSMHAWGGTETWWRAMWGYLEWSFKQANCLMRMQALCLIHDAALQPCAPPVAWACFLSRSCSMATHLAS